MLDQIVGNGIDSLLLRVILRPITGNDAWQVHPDGHILQWPVNVSAQSQYGQMCGPLQEKLEDDIRKLADVFWQVLNGFKVDPVMELEDWASSEKVLTGVAVELLSVRSLLFRMLRAGFPEGYHDMQSVVIDLWELGCILP